MDWLFQISYYDALTVVAIIVANEDEQALKKSIMLFSLYVKL